MTLILMKWSKNRYDRHSLAKLNDFDENKSKRQITMNLRGALIFFKWKWCGKKYNNQGLDFERENN